MTMLRFTLRPRTAFGSPLLGETLFGQVCWAIAHMKGGGRLTELLEGYAEGRPFLALSDAFPKGFLPLPALPAFLWRADPGAGRKELKRRKWVPLCAVGRPLAEWRDAAVTDEGAAGEASGRGGRPRALRVSDAVVHNTIDRITGTTGTGQFAPYASSQTWLNAATGLSVWASVDESRLSREDLAEALAWVGLSGYGRDASAGLGKFELDGAPEEVEFRAPGATGRTWLTLASCALCGVDSADEEKTFYRIRTHFGRHGDALALTGAPFKRPVVLAESAALVTLEAPVETTVLGRGLAGVSPAHPETVHQGWAPAFAIPDLVIAD